MLKIFKAKRLFSFPLRKFVEKFRNNGAVFNKISLNEKFVNEEETIVRMIEEIRGEGETQSVAFQRHDVIFIANNGHFKQFDRLKLGQLVHLNKITLAQCISIKEKVVTFMLASRER